MHPNGFTPLSLRQASIAFALTAFYCIALGPAWAQAECVPSGNLEIHYINVGQGGSTLIIGQDGTKILYDFGAVAGNRDIVPYLRNVVGLSSGEDIQYTMVSHRDRDHYMGYKDVVEAGYDIAIANYDSGSSKTSKTIKDSWLDPAKETKAGAVKPIPVGMRIPLGDCAEAVVMAANGGVYGEKKAAIKKLDENDRSISLFIRHGEFYYVLDGDLGAGPEKCTEHQTGQRDVQTRVASALIAKKLMDKKYGVDVLHIAHHGSESSTSAAYYNLMKPEVGLISVGQHNEGFLHPREDVVD